MLADMLHQFSVRPRGSRLAALALAGTFVLAGCDAPAAPVHSPPATAALSSPEPPTTAASANPAPLTPQEQATLNMQLVNAAVSNDAKAVTRLLADGAALEFKGAQGRTPLVAATKGNAAAAAKTLMEAGANVNAQDDLQDSAFLYAGAEGLDEILALTLAHGADVKSTNRYGGTALIPACEHAHVSTVKILLAAGVPVDHVNNLGWTGLLEAVILGTGGEAHQEVVRLLIETGADVNLADANGVTALAHARSAGQGEVAQLLVNAGAH